MTANRPRHGAKQLKPKRTEEGEPGSSSFPFVGRLDALRKSLAADALLVSLPANIFYLCGFSGSAGFLLVEARRATLFTDSRYTFQAREEVHGAGIAIVKTGLLRAVSDTLATKRGRISLAASLRHLTVAQRDAVGARLGKRLRWIDDASAVEYLRAIKSPAELAIMRD